MKKLFLPLLIQIILLLLFASLHSQSDYEKWKLEQEESFKKYKEKQDKDFIDFLKKDWQEFQVFNGIEVDSVPKPLKQPRLDKKPKVENIIDEEKKNKVTLPDTVSKTPIKKTPKTILHDSANLKLNFKFYNLTLDITYNEEIKNIKLKKINNNSIANFWERMCNSNYRKLLEEIEQKKNLLNLNGWAYCKLLYSIGVNIYHNDPSLSKLFVWFMLNKSGYKARIGYNENNIYLLLATDSIIFGNPYYRYGESDYYLISFNENIQKPVSIYSYKGNYDDANKSIDLQLNKYPTLGNTKANKLLTFPYKDKEYEVNLEYNNDIVHFYKDYPHTEYTVYFNAHISSELYNSLIKQLKPILEEKSTVEAVNILLHFIQNAFIYKTDAEQFGKEKYLFVEETIFYPACDCEDRSIIFAFLVKKLLGLKVIGLDYPGHVATAVNFPNDLNGDYVYFKNDKYLICDPTYINANVGMCIPECKDKKPIIIQIL